MIRIEQSSTLAWSADRVWSELQKTNTLREVAAGFVEYDGALPATWAEVNRKIDLKPRPLTRPWRWLPSGSHFVEVFEMDMVNMTIVTHEWGGLIKSWNHTMQVERVPDRDDICRYTDTILIDAGLASPIVGVFARQLYEHRHRNWRLKTSQN